MGIWSFITNLGWLQSALFLIGLGLVIVEMFIPGYGVPGITGIILLLLGVVLTAQNLMQVLVMIIVIIVLLSIAFALVIRSATQGRLSKKLVLSDSTKKESGYLSNEDLDSYLGKEGVSLTILRPAGTADFDGVRLDVVSEGEFIPKDAKIKVIKTAGRRIVVQQITM